MKKVFLTSMVLIFFASGCTTLKIDTQKVADGTATYYLPKKDLLLGFNVTYKTTQNFIVKKTLTSISGKDSSFTTTSEVIKEGLEIFVPKSFKVTDIQIAENLVSDFSQGYTINTKDFSSNKGKKLQQRLTFYPSSQSIAAINGEAGTYTTEILQGIATGLQVIGKVVGAVLSGGTSLASEFRNSLDTKAFANIYNMTYDTKKQGKNLAKTTSFTLFYDSVVTTIYVKGYVKVIKTEDASTSIEISDNGLLTQNLKLTKTLVSGDKQADIEKTTIPCPIYYRQPALVRYQLDNASKSPAEFLFSKTIAVPQLGSLKAISTQVKGRNPALVVEFDENGALKTYELNKDKTPASNADAIQKIGDSTKDLVTDYRLQKLQNEFNYLKLQKDMNDLKKPATEEK